MAEILNGKEFAKKIKSDVAERIEHLQQTKGIKPGLAVVLIGEDPASKVYVRTKTKACEKLGILSETYKLPTETTQAEALKVIDQLNHRQDIHGILVQLPLPKQLDQTVILNSVLPEKDVDGFHPFNVGRLTLGDFDIAPCTPAGIMEMLRVAEIPVKGAEAVCIGRSTIVGKPMGLLLLREHATMTWCHSRTRNLPEVARRADILVVAMGKPYFVTKEFVKPGAVVIDVGTNRVEPEFFADADELEPRFAKDFEKKGYTLVGDVKFPEVEPVAGKITPVPGGVGPLTIAMLMKNTCALAELSARR